MPNLFVNFHLFSCITKLTSAAGCQRADGALGFLTVRVPRQEDPHAELYDEDLPEHGLLVWDWTHEPAASKFLAHHHAGADNKADSVLINGKGAFRSFVSPAGAGDGAGDELQRRAAFTPREEFRVEQVSRHAHATWNVNAALAPGWADHHSPGSRLSYHRDAATGSAS